MRQPVSVVIPCYNQGRFLGEALASVMAQTVSPADVIVVDDGSRDDTAQVASALPGVTLVWQPNLGLAQARNRGLRQSRGEYVVFLDADDRLRPEAIEVGLRELSAHPDAAFTFGRCQRIDVHGHPLPTVPPPLVRRALFRELLTRNLIWTPAVAMFRRAVCGTALWFNPDVDAAADYDLYLRLTRNLPARAHEHVVAEYRLHRGSMSHDAALMLTSTLRVLRLHRPFLRQHPRAYEAAVQAWTSHYGEQLVEQLGRHGRRATPWRAVVRRVALLLRHYPHGVAQHLGRKLRRAHPLPTGASASGATER